MIRFNPHIQELLRLYTDQFKRRTEAARLLGLNPRSFKSRLDGRKPEIERELFDRLVEHLCECGFDDDSLLAHCGVASWDEVIEDAAPAEPEDWSREELVKRVMGFLDRGEMDFEKQNRPLVLALENAWGSVSAGLKYGFRNYIAETEERLLAALEADQLPTAVAELNRYERVLHMYLVKLDRINPSKAPTRKENLIAHVRPYLKRKVSLRTAVEKAVEAAELTLFNDEVIYERIHRKKTLDFHHFSLVRNYDDREPYEPGEFINHPGLGVGRVIEVVSRNRITVEFENKEYGVKQLAMRREDFIDNLFHSAS